MSDKPIEIIQDESKPHRRLGVTLKENAYTKMAKKLNDLKEKDLDKIPASLYLAKTHRKASEIGHEKNKH